MWPRCRTELLCCTQAIGPQHCQHQPALQTPTARPVARPSKETAPQFLCLMICGGSGPGGSSSSSSGGAQTTPEPRYNPARVVHTPRRGTIWAPPRRRGLADAVAAAKLCYGGQQGYNPDLYSLPEKGGAARGRAVLAAAHTYVPPSSHESEGSRRVGRSAWKGWCVRRVRGPQATGAAAGRVRCAMASAL
jgi:hypothetical protein